MKILWYKLTNLIVGGTEDRSKFLGQDNRKTNKTHKKESTINNKEKNYVK